MDLVSDRVYYGICRVSYPEGVRVAADESTEATLENGVLSAHFDIVGDLPASLVTVLGKRKKETESPEPPTKKKKLEKTKKLSVKEDTDVLEEGDEQEQEKPAPKRKKKKAFATVSASIK